MKQPYHHGALRQALLDAAEAILDREGIDALTLRAAAREAGVSHGAPAHHFGDLTGLLTELAASGFIRLRDAVQALVDVAAPDQRLRAMGGAYVSFARAHPGIFSLMFRSERLDWSSSTLSEAGAAAFALLTVDDVNVATGAEDDGVAALTTASTRWSLIHGLATLLIDGRLGAFADKVAGADIERLIEDVLAKGLRS